MELLIAITILAILAGLVLGVGAVAAETAREAQTESTIARIHTLLMDHYDTFRNRRVSLNDNYGTALNSAPGYDTSGLSAGQLLALGRTAGTRELLKIELPDRWSDVALEAVPDDLSDRSDDDATAPTIGTTYLGGRSSMSL
ncbi:MAG: hypothetical protein AAF596_08000, partial [Planctomycetota bacterium]